LDISAFPQYGIYCDESSQTKHRHIVIGAIFCHSSASTRIRKDVEQAIHPYGGTSELKWQKLKRCSLPMYKAAIDAVFQHINTNSAFYYCAVIDNHTVDHKTYNDGDASIDFNKYLFTLLYKFARVHRLNRNRFYAYLDERTTQHTPERLRIMLNARARRDLGYEYDPYRIVEFRDSKLDRLIQITDVLTGAVAYHTNEHHLTTGAARCKIDGARYIAKCAGTGSLAIATQYRRGFDIWHLDFNRPTRRKRTPHA
jgi:hypothetical protein